MSEVTRLIEAAQASDRKAAADLLPLVYDELRNLAARQMAQEKPGQTLNATALVHEAYLRLVGNQQFDGRGHFFAAAAEAMRRVLVENARRKSRIKHGGGLKRVELSDTLPARDEPAVELLAIDDALSRLATEDPAAAELVKLCYFAGLSVEDAADALSLGRSTAYRHWIFARAWLAMQVRGEPS
jgi:RNA polymerase sigma factor (TIGR02999 family)